MHKIKRNIKLFLRDKNFFCNYQLDINSQYFKDDTVF